MYLSLVLALGISIYPVFAGTISDEKQRSLLNIVQPVYHLDDDSHLKAVSKAQLEFKDNADVVTSEVLWKLGPSLTRTHFSGYIESHKKDKENITSLLVHAEDFDSFISLANTLRNFINPNAYNFALNTALLLRNDVSNMWHPPLWQINSRSFFTKEAIFHAFMQPRRGTTNDEIQNFNTGSYVDPEYRTAWYREDIGLNEMHVKVSSACADGSSPLGNQVDIFHFFSQILGRYDTERLAVNLPRVAELGWGLSRDNVWIREGYDSHLSTNLGEKSFAARPGNMDSFMDNIRDPDNPRTHAQFTYLSQKILDNIRTGFIDNENGEKEPITRVLLDDILRGLSKNKRLYTEQGLHDLGHEILAGITDPDGRYRQEIGVIGAQEATMRDPIFYRYHRFMYNIYEMYQMSLPPYSKSDFAFSGIRVDDVIVKSTENPYQENILETYMERVEAEILYDPTVKNHLSADPSTPLKIPYQRLNHDDFEYLIKVYNNNPNGDDAKAVVRIFIAPHNDETKMPFKSLNEQRKLFIEMDKFVTKLRSGYNVIKRSSVVSSVTFPSVDTYELWKAFLNTHGPRHDRIMGCGWPYHLLLPRGTTQGMDFDLFVMLTDWENDREESVGTNALPNFDFGSSVCGVKGAPYPDNKSRGFPFYRKLDHYDDLMDFADSFENIFVGSLKIIHIN